MKLFKKVTVALLFHKEIKKLKSKTDARVAKARMQKIHASPAFSERLT